MEGGHTMGHNISAIIGRRNTIQKLADTWIDASVIELPQEFAMVFLTNTFIESIEESYHISDVFCCPELDSYSTIAEQLLQEYSLHTRLAYIETDYFGGVGTQGGVLWENGQIIIQPRSGEGTINLLLKELGVICIGDLDAFDSLSLGNYRHMQDF